MKNGKLLELEICKDIFNDDMQKIYLNFILPSDEYE